MKKIVSIIFLFCVLFLFPSCKDKNIGGPTVSNDFSITQILPKNVVIGATVSITGSNLKNVTAVIFPGGIPATSFQLVGLNEITAIAPAGMTDGFIILKTVDKEIKATMAVKVVAPSYTSQFPDTAKIGKVITILGNNLLEIQNIVFPNNVMVGALSFNRKSNTEIQVTIPVGAALGKGLLKMITLSGASIDLGNVVVLSAGLPPLAPLNYVLFEDSFAGNWQDWGWSRTTDLVNKDHFRSGVSSMMVTYSQWGAVKFANSSVATTNYSEFTLAVYGGPGTDGKTITVIIGSNQYLVVKEGVWTEFKFPLSLFGNPATITEISLQAQFAGVVYFDHIGLR